MTKRLSVMAKIIVAKISAITRKKVKPYIWSHDGY
jgi:hypothetical protein